MKAKISKQTNFVDTLEWGVVNADMITAEITKFNDLSAEFQSKIKIAFASAYDLNPSEVIQILSRKREFTPNQFTNFQNVVQYYIDRTNLGKTLTYDTLSHAHN